MANHYQIDETIRKHRRRVTTMRRARSRYHAVPWVTAAASWDAERTIDQTKRERTTDAKADPG